MNTVITCLGETQIKRSTGTLVIAQVPFETRTVDDNGIEMTEIIVADEHFDQACDAIENAAEEIFHDPDHPIASCPKCGSKELKNRDDIDCRKSISGIAWIVQCKNCNYLIPRY